MSSIARFNTFHGLSGLQEQVNRLFDTSFPGRADNSVLLRDERAKQVQRLDLLMIVARGDVLRRLDNFLGF